MRFLPVLILVFCLTVGFFSSNQSLKKGQWIKQFHTHSITESLTKNGYQILSTTLPCPDTHGNLFRSWAEEPPVFHLLAAFFSQLGIQSPVFLPLFSYTLFMIATFLLLNNQLSTTKIEKGRQNLLFLLIFTTPALMRFSVQHLPDLLATALLVLGGYFTLKKNRVWMHLFLCLAVTTKALTLFPAVSFLIYSSFFDFQKPDTKTTLKNCLSLVISIGILVMPFVIWVSLLQYMQISNPFFHEFNIQNRYFGSLGLLIQLKYWLRMINWSASKGVGWVLFTAFCSSILYRRGRVWNKNRLEGLMFIWSFALLPYWVLVRQGNFVHDHYFLPFLLPISVLGSLTLSKIPSRLWLSILVFASVTNGILSLTQMKPLGLDNACDQEAPKYFN